jgi:hypothetical protein
MHSNSVESLWFCRQPENIAFKELIGYGNQNFTSLTGRAIHNFRGRSRPDKSCKSYLLKYLSFKIRSIISVP